MSNVNGTGSKNRAELYREKAANFKKLKKYYIFAGIMDLVLAVIWVFLLVRKSPGMGFAQAYSNNPLYFWLCIFFVVTAILSFLFIPLMRRLTFKGFEDEDIVE